MESKLRKQLKYPPFCDIIMLGFSSENENDIKKVSQQVHRFLKNKIETENIPIILYKPVSSPIDRIKNKFRWRIIIKCKFGENIIDIINDCNKEVFGIKNSSVNMTIDVNPNNML